MHGSCLANGSIALQLPNSYALVRIAVACSAGTLVPTCTDACYLAALVIVCIMGSRQPCRAFLQLQDVLHIFRVVLLRHRSSSLGQGLVLRELDV